MCTVVYNFEVESSQFIMATLNAQRIEEWGFIVRDHCVGTDLEIQGICCYGTGLLFLVIGYKLLRE